MGKWFLDFLASKDRKMWVKLSVTFTIVAAFYMTDGLTGFSFHYLESRQIGQVARISETLSDTQPCHVRGWLYKLKDERINRGIRTNELFSYRSNRNISTPNNANINGFFANIQ